jgi:hypothetical protein
MLSGEDMLKQADKSSVIRLGGYNRLYHAARFRRRDRSYSMNDRIPEEQLVDLGMHVRAELRLEDGEIETTEFDLVTDEQADFAAGLLGISTPLAQSILGKPAGAAVRYRSGDILEARILSVAASDPAALAEAAERRPRAARKAALDAQRASAIAFASSVNNKWGDYDPSAIEKWE